MKWVMVALVDLPDTGQEHDVQVYKTAVNSKVYRFFQLDDDTVDYDVFAAPTDMTMAKAKQLLSGQDD